MIELLESEPILTDAQLDAKIEEKARGTLPEAIEILLGLEQGYYATGVGGKSVRGQKAVVKKLSELSNLVLVEAA